MLTLLLLMLSCKQKEEQEILIYCGMTMADAITEIARDFQDETGIECIVIRGGSGELLRNIETGGLGDIYFPGSDSYISKAQQKGFIIDTSFVGLNRLALFSRKSSCIDPTIENFDGRICKIAIGNPVTGSVGKATDALLREKGIELINHEYKTDSRSLIYALKNGEADLVINWYAAKNMVDSTLITYEILEEANPRRLIVGLMKGQNTIGARRFIEYTKTRKEIFDRYGFSEL